MAPENDMSDAFKDLKILKFEYMSGFDIEFADANSKDEFVRTTLVVKHYANGTKSEKIPTEQLQVVFPKDSPRFLTVRCPVSEQDVIAVEFVTRSGELKLYHNWEKKN